MTTKSYKSMVAEWSPRDSSGRLFQGLIALAVVVSIIISFGLSQIDVPKKPRIAREPVPERIAKFITQRKKIEIPKPKPKPKEVKPKVLPELKPKIVRRKPLESEKKKPMTKEEKKAREKASNSGLLAFASEMSDLIDTSEVDKMLGGDLKKASSAATSSVSVDNGVLSAEHGRSIVSTSDHIAGAGSSKLTSNDARLVIESMFKDESDGAGTDKVNSDRKEGVNTRSQEEVSIVFDQNKGLLYSIYSRARRKNSDLQGKLVLEITIEPNGSVSKVRNVASELNDAALERRLIMRIEQFKFIDKDVETVTVTFPIEFLPS
ncbi:MAG: protein TonB [Flavobacteriales bacterium]|jgi:protein TonB